MAQSRGSQGGLLCQVGEAQRAPAVGVGKRQVVRLLGGPQREDLGQAGRRRRQRTPPANARLILTQSFYSLCWR